MCIFINRFYCFGVVGLCTLGVWLGKGLNRLYWFGVVLGMSVLLHRSYLVWCSRALYTWALGESSFLNRLYWFGVVGLCTLGLNISQ